MITLTEEQRRELDQPDPVQVLDPKTNETFVSPDVRVAA